MGSLCFTGSNTAIEAAAKKEDDRTSLPPGNPTYDLFLSASFDDITIRTSPMPIWNMSAPSTTFDQDFLASNTQLSSAKSPLTYLSSLQQVIKFRIGGELLCMTWNIHHESDDTPFGYYCDFRKLNIGERDCMYIEIIWDVARAFFETHPPIKMSADTKLRQIVPSFLLTDDVIRKFSHVAILGDKEREQVMKLRDTSLTEFLVDHMYNADSEEMRTTDFSFYKSDARNIDRKSSPLRPQYDERSFQRLLNKDPGLLPALILDSLHVFVIKFASWLIENQLTKTFSEFTDVEQIEKLTSYLSLYSPDDLQLPKQFVTTREKIYAKWNLVFQDINKVQQVEKKAEATQADIILLQQVTKGVFRRLTSRMSSKYAFKPSKFPSEQKETTLICLNKTTVKHEKDHKTKRIDNQNFAVPCRTYDILYYVGDVHLTAGEKAGELRKSEANQFRRALGSNAQVIIGGSFNEDLSSHSNPVAKIMLKTYNGIDHTQDVPLAYNINRMRTYFQFELRKAGKQDRGVGDGIFSTFPLVGEAFTDFLFTGLDNPSDYGPVFQRILVAGTIDMWKGIAGSAGDYN